MFATLQTAPGQSGRGQLHRRRRDRQGAAGQRRQRRPHPQGLGQHHLGANTIAANDAHGVHLEGGTTTANTVSGNLIGIEGAGGLRLGNLSHGVSSITRISEHDQPRNATQRIWFNTLDGVRVGNPDRRAPTSGNFVSYNDLRTNSQSGIGVDGPTSANEIEGNFISDNFRGISVANTKVVAQSVNTYRGNRIHRNRTDGVQITADVSSQSFLANDIRGNRATASRSWMRGGTRSGTAIPSPTIASTGSDLGGNAAGNVVVGSTITANDLYGVFVSNAPGNRVGTDVDDPQCHLRQQGRTGS